MSALSICFWINLDESTERVDDYLLSISTAGKDDQLFMYLI